MACYMRLYVLLFIYGNAIGQRQYIFVNQTKSANEAQSYCQKTYNTSLATVTTMEENEYITSKCVPHPDDKYPGCIIGLTDKFSERYKSETGWQWFDGSTGVSFYHWAPGQPSQKQWSQWQEDCVAIWFITDSSDGLWRDTSCDDESQHFFCNAPMLPSTIQPTTLPTIQPSTQPTTQPTTTPTLSPTTSYPTTNPTMTPSMQPTMNPTLTPITSNPTTIYPTLNPTKTPTVNPTTFPTILPTVSPTQRPTRSPTFKPSISPTEHPTQQITTTEKPEMEIKEDTIYNQPQTYAPNTAESKANTMDEILILGLILAVFVGLCCCIVLTMCCIFYTYRKKDVNPQYTMKQTSIQITPTDSNPEITMEMVHNEDGSVKMNKNRNDKRYMKVMNMELPKQTSFALHLTNTNVGTGVLMNDIINDMHKASIVEISDDEGVISDIDNTFTTPQ